MNLLYCLDEKYNNQCLVSIKSIISQGNFVENLFILHKNPKSFDHSLISDGVKNFEIYKFKNVDKKMINKSKASLKNTHLNISTYFRIFFENYLPNSISNILYLDSDTVCVNKFSKIYNLIHKNLIDNDLGIAARSIGTIETNQDLFNTLNMKSDTYFNAGVLFINCDYWKKNQIKNSCLLELKKSDGGFKYHDQDLLNKVFDGKYLELNRTLNQFLKVDEIEENQNIVDSLVNEAYLLHYVGKNKPWDKKYYTSKNSSYYQNIYYKLFNKNHY